jgi:hypothetical protein
MEKKVTDITKPWMRQMFKVKDLPKGEEKFHLKPAEFQYVQEPVLKDDD